MSSLLITATDCDVGIEFYDVTEVLCFGAAENHAFALYYSY